MEHIDLTNYAQYQNYCIYFVAIFLPGYRVIGKNVSLTDYGMGQGRIVF